MLFGQSDADYANKLEESKKSTSGYVFFHCHNLVCWRSKLQPIIATSTHEAELIAMHLSSQEAIWIRNFLTEIQAAVTNTPLDELLDSIDTKVAIHSHKLAPTMLMGDNLGAIHTANNPVSSKRSKHLDIRWLKIREYQEQHRLICKHIDGSKNIADAFTKPLPRDLFAAYRSYMGFSGPETPYQPLGQQ